MELPVRAAAIGRLLKEIEASGRGRDTLAVGGARELAAVLRRELERDAAPGAVRPTDEPRGAAVLVYVLGGDPDPDDEVALRRARRVGVPVVAVVAGPVADERSIPYVYATDVVRVGSGEGFPLVEIAAAVARRLGENGAPLAARIPLLRAPVCETLVAAFARRNGIVAAAVFVPGADLPLLTLNQLRLVLRIAQAYGQDVTRERLPEIAATLGAGLGMRAVARELLDVVPGVGWAVKGAVAYGGTRAVGEAAVRRFAAGVQDADGSSAATPPPA